VIFNGGPPVLDGLDQSAVTLALLEFRDGWSADVGLPEINASGYTEYRDTFLKIGATVCNVRCGSSRLKIDFGAVTTSLTVQATGQPADDGIPAALFAGSSSANVINVVKGSVGLKFFAGQSLAATKLRMGYETNPAGDADVTVGDGLGTIASIDKQGGTLLLRCDATTVTQIAGETTVAAGSVTTLSVRGGTCFWNSDGTLGTPLVSGDGVLDFTRDPRPKTVTNPIDLYGAAAMLVDHGIVVSNLRVDLNEGATAAQVDLGLNVRITRGAVA
jgi:hypothetical protein